MIKEYVVLYNKPPGSGTTEARQTEQLGAGTPVAIVDEEKNDTGVWVKVLQLEERITGWTERSNVNIRVNPLDSRYFKWLFAVLQGACTEQVTVSPRLLKVVRKGRLSTKTVEIPVSELEELALPGGLAADDGDGFESLPVGKIGKGIVARSDRQMVVFGGALTPSEMRWVHANIQRVLSS